MNVHSADQLTLLFNRSRSSEALQTKSDYQCNCINLGSRVEKMRCPMCRHAHGRLRSKVRHLKKTSYLLLVKKTSYLHLVKKTKSIVLVNKISYLLPVWNAIVR